MTIPMKMLSKPQLKIINKMWKEIEEKATRMKMEIITLETKLEEEIWQK